VVMMTQIEEHLEALCKLATKLGATNAVSFSARGVAVDERVRLKCRIPVCDDYGLNLMCPPNVISIKEFREILAKYNHAVLIQMEMRMPAEVKVEIRKANDVGALYKDPRFLESYKKHFTPVKLRLQRIVQKIESQAFSQGYRFTVGFIAGSCKLCPKCVAVDSCEPCRNPFRARPSMEAMGIDAYQTAKNAGLPFDIPAKDKIVWNGLVLIN
jgi:predicted metal-binding protein